MSTNLEPQSYTIVVDLHGVVFRLSPKHIASLIWHYRQKYRLIMPCLNIPLIYNGLKAVAQKQVIEQLINTLAQNYPSFAAIKPLALEITNAQQPSTAMVELLKQLHNHRHRIIAFSNIGAHSISILNTRYPEIFKLFDQIIHTSAHDNYVAKPSPAAFAKLMAMVNPTQQRIIFIDDTGKNLSQASALGLHSIPFKNTKKLEKSLKLLKIL